MNCPEKNPVIVLTGRLLFRLCKLSCLLHSVGCGPNFSICDRLGQVVSVIDELFMYLCTCIVGIFRRQSRPLYAIVGFDRVERWPTEVRLLQQIISCNSVFSRSESVTLFYKAVAWGYWNESSSLKQQVSPPCGHFSNHPRTQLWPPIVLAQHDPYLLLMNIYKH